jgi:hypothetical protein
MKTVSELLNENKHLNGHVCVRYDAASGTVAIEGTAGGLLLLSRLIEAQANRLGNVNVGPTRCLSVIGKAQGFLNTDSVRQLQIHCESQPPAPLDHSEQ